MTRDEARSLMLRSLAEIAPEVDPEAIDPATPLRDQVDLDSMDFLNLVTALSEEAGSDIPESDYPALDTLDSASEYLAGIAR